MRTPLHVARARRILREVLPPIFLRTVDVMALSGYVDEPLIRLWRRRPGEEIDEVTFTEPQTTAIVFWLVSVLAGGAWSDPLPVAELRTYSPTYRWTRAADALVKAHDARVREARARKELR